MYKKITRRVFKHYFRDPEPIFVIWIAYARIFLYVLLLNDYPFDISLAVPISPMRGKSRRTTIP